MSDGWRRRVGLVAACVALLLAGVSGPAAGERGWTPPTTLSKGSSDFPAATPQVGVDAEGAVFIWIRWDGSRQLVEGRARAADGTLSAVQTLSTGRRRVLGPQVATDAAGDAVFVWNRFDGSHYRVKARARSAGGALSPIQAISAPGQDAFWPQVAVDADGDAVFTWYRSDGTNARIQTRARSAHGNLSRVRTLSAGGHDAVNPEVAIDANGDAVFIWTRFDGSHHRIQARSRSASGALSTIQTLSAAGRDALWPQVAVDADGHAAFTWTRSDGSYWRVQTRARSANGALSPVQTLSAAGHDGNEPQVAVDAQGNAVFTWYQVDGSAARIHARIRSTSSVLSPVQILSEAGQNAWGPQVGVDARGDAVFSWYRSDGSFARVQARSRSAGGAWTVVRTLSPKGAEASDPEVAVARDGHAAVTWRLLGRIQAAFGS